MLEKLEILMNKSGINKAELSRGADIPYTTIDGMWKRGTDNIKRSTLIKLARYFKCSIDYIADDDVTMNNLSSPPYLPDEHTKESISVSAKELENIKKYRALDERGKQTVDMVLDSQYEITLSKKETSAELSDEEIEKELESYKQELLAEKKGKTLLVSDVIKGA